MGSSVIADGGSTIDLRRLSQSQLCSLAVAALSSSSALDDVVTPNIDPSIFNESGFSRLPLAPLSSSSSRRRTPHLRPTSFPDINHSDLENARIVTLLKHLFTDQQPGPLFTVKVDYSNSLPPQQLTSSPPSNVGHKRKRGRPPTPPVNVVVDNADGFASEIDREVLNGDGVAVDLAALGAVEHPFGEEIRRRTQGLGSEEELLGFLKGLNGQWGSRRRKKRIVDAAEFGTALPVGWKLLLSLKRINGHVSLHCRRYISPSGLHFVSCKGVSSYLLSLHSVQDLNPQYNEIGNDVDKVTSVVISDLAMKDDGRKEDLIYHVSSPAFGSTSSNHEMQVEINAGVLPEGRTGEILHCNKCKITFTEKAELLKHESSVHCRNRYKNGMRISDGVIIRDRKYECQFCHKTFSERRRYNGHVGAHVRYQAKTAGESPAESVDPSSFGNISVEDTMFKASVKSDNAIKICNAITNNELNMCPPCYIDNKHVGEFKDADGNMRAVNKATGAVAEINSCSVVENKCFHEDAHASHSVAEIDDASGLQVSAGNCSLPLDDVSHGVIEGSMVENSALIEKPEQNVFCESKLLDSNDHVEQCDVPNNEHICQTTNELKLDLDNFAVNDSEFDFFGSLGDQEKGSADSVKQQGNFEYLPNDTTEKMSTSGSLASKLTIDPKISMLTMAYAKACVEDNVSRLIGKKYNDKTSSFGTFESGCSKAGNVGVTRHKETQFGTGPVIRSWDKQENVSKKHDTDALACLLKEPETQNTSKSRFIALSGFHEDMPGCENDSDEVCRRKMDIPEFDDFQNYVNGESIDPFRSSHAGLNSSTVTGSELDKKLGVSSAFTSATEKRFCKEDNMIRITNDALGEHKKEPSGSILFSQSGVSDVSNEAYTLDKIYATPVNPCKHNKIEISGKHDLSLSFGNLHTDLCADSNRVEHEIYKADSVNIQSIHKTYSDQTRVGMRSSVPGDLKQGRPFEIGLPTSSFNNRTHELDSSFDVPNPGGDKIGISSQDFVVGFGNSSSQSGGCVAADGHENLFQGCLDAVSGPHIPPSTYFDALGLISDKGKEGLFSVDKSYDVHADMLRAGRNDPVEYSFMGEQNSNSSPAESKFFSYKADMEQGLDPSFWLGKDSLMSNASNTNCVTLECVWCRNVFFHDAVQAGNQTGAIGTMCPSCSSRITGQFNVL